MGRGRVWKMDQFVGRRSAGGHRGRALGSRPLPVRCGGRRAPGALAGRTEARRALRSRARAWGAAGTPRTRSWRGGARSSLGRARRPAPKALRAVGGGTAAYGRPGSAGTGWGRGPHAAPRLSGWLHAPSPQWAAKEDGFLALLSSLAQSGWGWFRGDPWRTGPEEDQGPARVRPVQGQGCVFLLRTGRGKKRACLA